MYLEKLDIQGFKSFAQPTTLVFNKELTAIVGPNGSGKSNIADAIRWVLGEQSLKLLRGKKSDDVIFAGSDTKGRLGFAKVTLYLQNIGREAGIDYDQVVIERTIDRKGESEYVVNGSKVRLVDVQILLAKAHVGQKSYSVIGQGMIDGLLTSSAQDRKDFFDEATGVRHYQLKKNQALHKLEQTEENLSQAELVLQEIEPRLRTLTRQVRRLERKEDLEQQLKQQQNDYYGYLLGTLTTQLEALQKKFSTEDGHLTTLAAEQKNIQNQLDSHDQEQGRTQTYDVLQKKLWSAQQEYNTLTKKKIVLEGQKDIELIKTGNQSQVVLKQRLDDLINKKNIHATRVQELRHEIEKLEKRVAQFAETAAASSQKLKQLEIELGKYDAEVDSSSVEKHSHELHAEHEALLANLENITTAEELPIFKKSFKAFAEKLHAFFQSLRVKKIDNRDSQWKNFTALNQEHDHISKQMHDEKLALGMKKHECTLTETQLKDIEREIKTLETQLTSDASIRQKTITTDITELEAEIAAKEKQMQELRHEIDSFNQREENKKTELVNLQKKFRTIQYDYTIKNNELTSLKVELAKLETKKEDLEKEIRAEAPNFVMHPVSQLNEQETKENIETLKRQLNIIGGIDTETVKEYQEVKEKHTFLTQQTTDLRSAEKSLIEMIDDLDEHISKQFQQSFKNINAMYGKYFKRLFSGGHAKLILQMLEAAESEEAEEETENSDGPKEKKIDHPVKKIKTRHLDYSIEIHATPPGKKLSSITMLSGGEKALTSIALVCAIIANNPPPFVVLDEVDAALDEANSIRFAEIISELLDKSQFITITHNRATMHQAKILYGVTMRDDGISRLLSVNFEEANKLTT